MQALDYRGLYTLFSGNPTPPPLMQSFQFGGLTLDLSTLERHSMYALPIPQRRMEQLLEQRARELHVEIRRGSDVTAVTQDLDQVTVDVQGPEGAYALSARFLVGADGGHSIVRKQTGIGFPGHTDDGFVSHGGQVVIHPPVALPGGGLEVAGTGKRLQPNTFTRTETGVFAYGTFQPGIYRVAAIEWGQSASRGQHVHLDRRAAGGGRPRRGGDVPMSEPPAADAVAMSRVTTASNSRQADRYRDGRVFLVGDAAHVHSGVGGAGLNLGMQDALNLGWKLAAEIRGWAPPGLLDTYETERYPVGERVIMNTRAQTALLAAGPYVTALRSVVDELLREENTVQHIADLMAGADIRYDMPEAGHPLTGGWMPDLRLTRAVSRPEARASHTLGPGASSEQDVVRGHGRDFARGRYARHGVASGEKMEPGATSVTSPGSGSCASARWGSGEKMDRGEEFTSGNAPCSDGSRRQPGPPR